MNNHPDASIIATARLVENLAILVPQVRHHVRRELVICDSIRDHTVGAGMPTVHRTRPMSAECTQNITDPQHPDELITCGVHRPCPEHDAPVTLTPVERAAEARMSLDNWLADIEAQCRLIATATHDALTNGRKLIGTRAPVSTARCCDGLHGKDITPELTGAIANCSDLPHKTGLCNKHYQAWWRERRDRGVDTRDMFQPGVTGPYAG